MVCSVYVTHSIQDDDFAAYVLVDTLKQPDNITAFLYERAMRTHLPCSTSRRDSWRLGIRTVHGQEIHEGGQKVIIFNRYICVRLI